MKITLPRSLPDELIEDILLRLPVRSLLRLKCVCKSWLSLISNPQFAKSHFDLAAATTDRLLLKFHKDSDPKVNFVDIEDESAKVVFNLPNPSPTPIEKHGHWGRVDVVGSCRGFLLLTTASYRFIYFVIWNPSTGLQKRFNKACSSITLSYFCGFGYDSSTDDYVAVTVTFPRGPLGPTEVHCFSMRTTNSWSCIKGTVSNAFRYAFRCDEFRYGLFLNGALHWLVYYSDNNRYKIIAFDVMQKKLSEISLPRELRNQFPRLRVMAECLSVCVKGLGTVHVWMMKKYKVHSSWTNLFLFSTQLYSLEFVPTCFTKNGEIVGRNRHKTLVRVKGSLNDKAEPPGNYAVELVQLDFRYRSLHSGTHRESLLSLWVVAFYSYPELWFNILQQHGCMVVDAH